MQHRANSRKFQHAVDRRRARQHLRIRQGWHSGRLNRKQVARLHRNQKRIGRMERRFGTDGHYTRHERRLMGRALDRSSKRIWRMKHNRNAWRLRYRLHKRFRGGFHRLHRYYRYVYRVYPVYE